MRNLERILEWFEDDLRELVVQEPSSKEAERYADSIELLSQGRKPKSEETVMEAYRQHAFSISYARETEMLASRYGQTVEEIRGNLRGHVNGHLECFREYLGVLAKKAGYRVLAGGEGKFAEDFLEWDKNYLGMFSPLKSH